MEKLFTQLGKSYKRMYVAHLFQPRLKYITKIE